MSRLARENFNTCFFVIFLLVHERGFVGLTEEGGVVVQKGERGGEKRGLEDE